LADADVPLSLGESVTPLLRSHRLGDDLDLRRVFIKDEGRLPTGSFKARGAAVGVTMARALGQRRLALPTAGNAGGAWAAYGACAGCTVLVAMPQDAPLANQKEVLAAGAELLLVPGTIADAGRAIAERVPDGYFDAGTFREPYRVEGKKTIAFELAEQLGWRWPSVIVYPTGGAVGLIGIWKAVQELAAVGWVTSPLPRLVAVQAAGCAPLVTAFRAGADHAEPVRDPHTVAPGIRVPSPLADRLALRCIRESAGTAIAVSDADLLQEMRRATRLTGILWSPEGAATIAAVRALRANGWLAAEDEVVLLNTGSGLKTLGLF
jgi:threonine synthase